MWFFVKDLNGCVNLRHLKGTSVWSFRSRLRAIPFFSSFSIAPQIWISNYLLGPEFSCRRLFAALLLHQSLRGCLSKTKNLSWLFMYKTTWMADQFAFVCGVSFCEKKRTETIWNWEFLNHTVTWKLRDIWQIFSETNLNECKFLDSTRPRVSENIFLGKQCHSVTQKLSIAESFCLSVSQKDTEQYRRQKQTGLSFSWFSTVQHKKS